MGKLFQPAKYQWDATAIVGGPFSDGLEYSMGYFEAASALVGVAISTHQMDRLFFPICFCYRHFVELVTKRLLSDFNRFTKVLQEAGENVPIDGDALLKELDKEHSLAVLSQRLKGAFEVVTGDQFDPTVWRTLGELHNLDTDSQRLRYSVRTKKRVSFPTEEQYDLVQIRNHMKVVEVYLLGMVDWLDDQIRGAEEFIAEFEDQFQDEYQP